MCIVNTLYIYYLLWRRVKGVVHVFPFFFSHDVCGRGLDGIEGAESGQVRSGRKYINKNRIKELCSLPTLLYSLQLRGRQTVAYRHISGSVAFVVDNIIRLYHTETRTGFVFSSLLLIIFTIISIEILIKLPINNTSQNVQTLLTDSSRSE